MISVVFFGTNEFAAAILRALVASDLFGIKLVVTQPDRPVGRHQIAQKSAVKILAEQVGLPVEQPASLKNFDFSTVIPPTKHGGIHDKGTDINVVVEYGLLIPPEIVELPKFGTINIHPSLLPAYRGPSPIQSALLNGEEKSGVSIMLVDNKVDHGPILAQEESAIEADDNYLTLSRRMAVQASGLLLKTIPLYIAGRLAPRPQDDSRATFCKILTREDGCLNFSQSAAEIYNQYRGLALWPGIWTAWNGQRLKLLKIALAERQLAPGLVRLEDKKMFIGCGVGGAIEILEIQPEGKKAMTAIAFLNGNAEIDGVNLQSLCQSAKV